MENKTPSKWAALLLIVICLTTGLAASLLFSYTFVPDWKLFAVAGIGSLFAFIAWAIIPWDQTMGTLVKKEDEDKPTEGEKQLMESANALTEQLTQIANTPPKRTYARQTPEEKEAAKKAKEEAAKKAAESNKDSAGTGSTPPVKIPDGDKTKTDVGGAV